MKKQFVMYTDLCFHKKPLQNTYIVHKKKYINKKNKNKIYSPEHNKSSLMLFCQNNYSNLNFCYKNY